MSRWKNSRIMSLLLLFDIGNTHTHIGLGDHHRVRRQTNIPTESWLSGEATDAVRRFIGSRPIAGVALCSVVPKVTPRVERFGRQIAEGAPLTLTPKTIRGVGIDYPKPNTIGPDRLANAVAVHHSFGAPAVVVDFGT